MSNLPEFLQGKSCFDGRPSPSVSEEFLKEFYAKGNERKKHMKVCPGVENGLHHNVQTKYITQTRVNNNTLAVYINNKNKS